MLALIVPKNVPTLLCMLPVAAALLFFMENKMGGMRLPGKFPARPKAVENGEVIEITREEEVKDEGKKS